MRSIPLGVIKPLARASLQIIRESSSPTFRRGVMKSHSHEISISPQNNPQFSVTPTEPLPRDIAQGEKEVRRLNQSFTHGVPACRTRRVYVSMQGSSRICALRLAVSG